MSASLTFVTALQHFDFGAVLETTGLLMEQVMLTAFNCKFMDEVAP